MEERNRKLEKGINLLYKSKNLKKHIHWFHKSYNDDIIANITLCTRLS